jgi:hypothetical protein
MVLAFQPMLPNRISASYPHVLSLELTQGREGLVFGPGARVLLSPLRRVDLTPVPSHTQ